MKLFNVGDDTELTTTNKPKAKIFEWLINPLLIIKEQIKAENLSVSEEDYLCKLALLNGDPERVKNSTITAPESDRKRAELDALARRYMSDQRTVSYFNFILIFQSVISFLLWVLNKFLILTVFTDFGFSHYLFIV